MREIKFRGWDKTSKKWRHYKLSFLVKKGANVFTKELENWCEYTGLKDSKGKEIYEGDIVRYTREDRSTMIEKIVYNGSQFTMDYSTQDLGTHLDMGGSFEVIGNIYENKNLLEGENGK